MKPLLIDRAVQNHGRSFTVQIIDSPNDFFWHYHQQVELVMVMEGSGTRFTGDVIKPITKGEVVLLGQYLPHLWKFDQPSQRHKSKIIIVHIDPETFGKGLSSFKELYPIQNLFSKAAQGIEFNGTDASSFREDFSKIENMAPLPALLALLQMLERLSKDQDQRTISSRIYHKSHPGTDARLMPVYECIFDNFTRPITLDELADLACMNPASFCRYFKKVHNQTPMDFINEVRIGYASKLLIENKTTVFPRVLRIWLFHYCKFQSSVQA